MKDIEAVIFPHTQIHTESRQHRLSEGRSSKLSGRRETSMTCTVSSFSKRPLTGNTLCFNQRILWRRSGRTDPRINEYRTTRRRMSAVCRFPKPIVEELRRVVPNCPAVGARSTADRQATQLPPQCRKLLRHPILLAVF